MNSFSERFSSLLTERGWNAEDAARHLTVSAVAVRAWAGMPGTKVVTDPRASHLLAICDVFNVRAEWLMNGDEPKERQLVQPSDWPFMTSRERLMQMPLLVQTLIDRLIFDTVEILSAVKTS